MKKKIIFLLLMVFCFFSLTSYAAEPSDYELTVKALSRVVESARELSKTGAAGYNVLFRRDPLQPLVDGSGNVINSAGLHAGLSVQGVIWSDKFKSVLIDDELYGQGDTIGPYRILKVRADGFLAQKGNETVFVPLYSDRHSE